MDTYALIKNGRVENVIVADAAFIEEAGARIGEGGAWVLLDEAQRVNGQRPGPGWLYNSGTRRFARPT